MDYTIGDNDENEMARDFAADTLVKRAAGMGAGGVLDRTGGQGLWEPTKLAVGDVGPDGAVYVVNYAGFFNATGETSIVRYLYKGAQCDVDIPVEKAGCKANDPSVTLDVRCPCGTTATKGIAARGRYRWSKMSAHLGGPDGVLEIPRGITKADIIDLRGGTAYFDHHLTGGGMLKLPSRFPPGLYRVMRAP